MKRKMERRCKAVICKLRFPIDGCLNYNVQLWYDFEKTFVYAGNGSFFHTLEEAEEYAEKHANAGVELR